MYYLTYSPDWPGAHEKAKQRIINLLWLQCVYHVLIVAACKLRWSYLYFYLFLYLLVSVMTSSSDCDVLMNKELLLPMSFYKRCFLLRTFGSLAWTKRHATKQYLITPHKTLNILNKIIVVSLYNFFFIICLRGQILQADGSNQSACINAATLALIDAGIPMKDYVSACSVSFINDKPLMDINYLEESFGGPQLSLAVLPKSGNIVMFQMDSRLHVDNLEKVLELAKKGCSDIHVLLRQTVHDYSQECLTSLTGNWIN